MFIHCPLKFPHWYKLRIRIGRRLVNHLSMCTFTIFIHHCISLIRPEMAVFALRFGGFALTADTWLAQKDLLERYIVGGVK